MIAGITRERLSVDDETEGKAYEEVFTVSEAVDQDEENKLDEKRHRHNPRKNTPSSA